MIYEVIQTIADGLNVFFKARLRTTEDKAVISAIVNQDGSVAQLEENKVLITLVNIEKEPINVGKGSNGKQRVNINFFLLFSCYFSNANYSEALKFLAFIMNYLNDNSSMDISEGGGGKSTSSSSGPKVQIEIESLTVDQNSNLWSAIGAKFMPSVLYKIRMIPLDSDSLIEFRPSAAVLSGNTKETGGGANNQGTGGTGQGNTSNSDGGTNSNTTSGTPPTTSTPTQPPPSTNKTEPEKKSKRPITLAGGLLYNNNEDDDDDDDDNDDKQVNKEETITPPVENNRPQANDSNNLTGDSVADFDEGNKEKIESKNPSPKVSDRPVDQDADRDTPKKDDDTSNQMGQSSKNSPSFFSPFSAPKKPTVSNVKPPENDINKDVNQDPNKNLNKDSEKK